MSHRIRIAAAGIVVVFSGGGTATAAPADASAWEDRRPCATDHEVWITPVVNKHLTRRELEKRWEVSGLGHRSLDAWKYPMCDSDDIAFAFIRDDGRVLTVGVLPG